MKPPPFSYHTPANVQECLELLNEYNEDCVILAGGQSLIPLLRFRMAQPKHVVSLRDIRGQLAYINETKGGIAIGACTTYAATQRSEIVKSKCPFLLQAIDLIATPAVRTRGTLCGNLCNADPASELPAMALLLGVSFRLRSRTSERIVNADEFFVCPYTTARRSDELLVEIVVPARRRDEQIVIKEVARLRGGFPMAGIAVALVNSTSASERSAKIVCFGANPVQTRARNAEAELVKCGFTADGIDAASIALVAEIEPHSDAFASKEYRQAAAQELLKRAVEEAIGATCS
jgi:carbon-monoxide dehydrogenase medium subunit